MTASSRIAAMSASSPPQFGQWSMSSSNTRMSSHAQLMLARSLNRLSAAGGGRLFVAGTATSRVGHVGRLKTDSCRSTAASELALPTPCSRSPRWTSTSAKQRDRTFVVGHRTHGLGCFPVIQPSKQLRHQRQVSRYCRHSRSPARGDACSRTATQSRPTSSGVECRSNVCWSRAPTGAADPYA